VDTEKVMTHFKPGTTVPSTGIYWCTVCKTPRRFTAGEQFPECDNLCGRGFWELVRNEG
jgi:hypothetical protein